MEQDLQFLGIIIFENKLKSGTPPVIENLKRAKIRQIMCTGNNDYGCQNFHETCNTDFFIY